MELVQTCIALATLYALLAIVASAAKEALEAWAQRRKKDFRAAVTDLLGPQGAVAFLEHPHIQTLLSTVGPTHADKHRHWPSYVDAATFAQAALDVLRALPAATAAATGPVRGDLAQLVQWAEKRSADSLQVVQAAYEERMQRLGGSFKRNAQVWLLGIGFVLAAALDADTLQVAHKLSTDATARAALVNLAGEVKGLESLEAICKPTGGDAAAPTTPTTPAAPPTPAASAAASASSASASGAGGSGTPGDARSPQQVIDLARCVQQRMPTVLGWTETKWNAFKAGPWDSGSAWWGLLWKLLGYVLTAFAVSLGAPFWFDLIAKVSNPRATSKPKPAA